MDDLGKFSKLARFLITAASFVILVAGMRASSSLLVPFLLSAFIAIICSPLLFWMQRRGLPKAVAVLSILISIMAVGLLLAAFIARSLDGLTSALPLYQERLADMTAALVGWLQGLGVDVSDQLLTDYFNPQKAMRMVANMLTGLQGVLTNVFLILLTVIFIMLEASSFPKKLYAALSHPEESLASFDQLIDRVNRYLAIKTLFSALTGVVIWLWLSILGVDFAFLWGLLAFLLNYVPNIGSIIAAIPAVFLALLQLGTGSALLTGLAYLVVNTVLGSLIEPRFMGRGLGLSTLVVFLSLVFWGWILGPVGMLLSVPLTMIVQIALESNEDTRWIAVILGSTPSGDTGAKKVNTENEETKE
ncbi:MAG: AI-2E family transporter [Deltaproteobacteria bacterium]|nr:MAG: AI-2E family transporter [Deltaproteobacteria bacterium]